MIARTKTAQTFALFLVLSAMAVSAIAVPPAITYQGQLKLDGVPISGAADFRLRLWDAPAGGEVVAEAQPLVDVEIVDGLFTLPLTFDADPSVLYGQGSRYLEVQVSYPRETEFIPLTPRQPLTPAPFALYALDVPGGGGGELTLPFSGTNVADETGLAITNSGLAPAAAFATDNPSNAQPALIAHTAGSGPALLASTGGNGPAVWGLAGDGGGTAGFFRVIGDTAGQEAIKAENTAMGPAGLFKTTSPENTNPALIVETFSDGPAATFTTHSDPNNVNLGPTVAAENNSFGMAGQFAVQNNESTSDVLRASTNGGGNAIHAYVNGLGRAGFFEVDNFGVRTVPAFEVVSNGRGAGAGVFRATSAINAAPALEAIAGGFGPAARFTHTAIDGIAADFIGDVSVEGTAVADAFAYTQPHVNYLPLSPFGFKAIASEVSTVYFGGAFITTDPFGMPALFATVSVPDGAMVTGMTVHVDDSSVPVNLEISLMYYPFVGNGTATLCTVNSSGSGGVQSLTTTAAHAVDTQSGHLVVACQASSAWPGSDLRIKGAVIEYETYEAN